MTRKLNPGVDHSLCGSETDQTVRPKLDGVILEKVQSRVDIMRCRLELSQGGEVPFPSASGWVSSSMTLDLKTSGKGSKRKREEESLTILTCSIEQT